MGSRQLGLVSFGLAAVTLILVLLDAFLVIRNQGFEAEVQQRQLTINQAVQVNQVSNALLQMLGQTVLKTQDPQITALLSEFGITVSDASAPSPPAPAAPAAP